MALNRTQLVQDLLTAFKAPEAITGPKEPPGRQQELQQEELVEKLADAIQAYVRSGEVKGVQVWVTGATVANQKNSVSLE